MGDRYSSFGRGGFDYHRDVEPLRGSYFSTAPTAVSTAGTNDGLTEFQRRFLTDEFMTQVLPLQKELDALEERRLSSRLNNMRLEEQTMQLEALREETRKNRDLLTRLPTLMQGLDLVNGMIDEDPETAALYMLEAQQRHPDVIAANPAARIAVDATQRRLEAKAQERKAQEARTLDRVAKFASVDDPALIGHSEKLAASLGTPEAKQLIEDAKLIRGATKRAAEKSSAQKVAESHVKWLDDAEDFLKGLESEKVEEVDEKGFSVTKFKFKPETESLVDMLAANLLSGLPPEPDLLKRRNQMLARIAQEKQKLLAPPQSGKVAAPIPINMRGSSTSR